jgi:1-acyl-sn-glycerol-3-phosphate acyltransferase
MVVSLALVALVSAPFPGYSKRFKRGIVSVSNWAAMKILGMRVRIVGSPPRPPFILVANHLGYIDIVLVRLVVKAFFVSKAEIAAWPFVGWLTRLAGTLFLDRRNKRDLSRINSLLDAALGSGNGIVIFPEGTSSSGRDIKKFHSGLLAYPAMNGFPVHAAALHYSTSAGPDASHAVCWWGDMTFVDHLYRLLGLRGFDARITFAPEPLAHRNRKTLAAGLEEQVGELFEPVEGAPST